MMSELTNPKVSYSSSMKNKTLTDFIELKEKKQQKVNKNAKTIY